MDSLTRQGRALFNEQRYFEAHEAFEDLWRAAPERERPALQGLVQVCAGLVKHQRGQPASTRTLLLKGLAKLEDAPPGCPRGIDVDHIIGQVRDILEALEEGHPPPVPSLRPPHDV